MPSYHVIDVRYETEKTGTSTIIKESITCPYCQTNMIPDFLYGSITSRTGLLVFSRCTNHNCERSFLSQYQLIDKLSNGNNLYGFSRINHYTGVKDKQFNDIIRNLSPSFVKIYNQAYAAQQLDLNEICGTGYRKALEFVIKDYIISNLSDEKQVELIQRKLLMQCIENDVQEDRIKLVAKRATWLGNDETHYVRKWEDKDINEMTSIINLAIHWIESEIATKRLLEEMPEPKK